MVSWSASLQNKIPACQVSMGIVNLFAYHVCVRTIGIRSSVNSEMVCYVWLL